MSPLLLILLAITIFSINDINAQTPLDDYIKAADPYYNFIDTGITAKGTNVAGHWEAYLINMTSQMWLNSTYVDRPIWWHWLWIIIPDNVLYIDWATVVGTGNHNSANWPDKNEEYFRASQYVATHTKTIVAVLYNIPNEPLTFYNDPLHKSRSEDAIIAFGWRQYLNLYNINPQDPYINNWLVLLPMAKSVIKAMDTVSNFTSTKQFSDKYKVSRFAVAGASKRGWTTWLAAAADTRVEAFVPMVFDMPNMHDELHHMWRAYGGWTFAFADYWDENLTMDLDTPGFYGIMNATDPIMFFDRYQGRWKMPIDAVNDEFFMPDDEAFWWNKFPEPKYFQINPDAEHSLATAIEELVPTLSTFITLYLEKDSRGMPVIDWEILNGTGNITVSFKGNTSQIVEAVAWHGRSCWNDRRDFRLINLDNPCHCGIYTGGYCIDLESVFLPVEIMPETMTGTSATYNVAPFKDPSTHWSGFMVSIRVKFFDATHPWLEANGGEKSECDGYGYNDADDRLFLVEYGEMQFTTQVSITPQTFPFPDCTGESCYGTLV